MYNRISRLIVLAGAMLVFSNSLFAAAQTRLASSWSAVPPVDFSKLKPSDFQGEELNIPSYLTTFDEAFRIKNLTTRASCRTSSRSRISTRRIARGINTTGRQPFAPDLKRLLIFGVAFKVLTADSASMVHNAGIWRLLHSPRNSWAKHLRYSEMVHRSTKLYSIAWQKQIAKPFIWC